MKIDFALLVLFRRLSFPLNVPSVIFLVGIDTSSFIGKVDKTSLPQQALMELLINGITNREVISGSKEEPNDIEGWWGVILNEDHEVIDCEWNNLGGRNYQSPVGSDDCSEAFNAFKQSDRFSSLRNSRRNIAAFGSVIRM